MGEIYTGNNITINNTGNKIAKIKIGGADYQETRSGKNFFNIYDLMKGMGTLDIDSEDFVTVTVDNSSGSSSKYYNVYTNPSSKIEKSTKYYLVLEVKEVSGVGSILVHSTSPTDNIPQFEGSKVYSLATLQAGDIKIDEITSVDDLSVAKTMLRTFLAFNAGQSGSITFRLSVLKDEPTLETFIYEKYGVMPSPEYPSKVETVASNINELEYPFEDTTKTTNGITFTDIGDGTVIANGTATAKAYFNLSKTTLSSGKHILSVEPGDGGNSSPFKYFVKFGTINITKTYRFELTESFTPTESYLCINEGVTVNNLVFKIKIEPGEKATSWSPYETGNIEININNKNFLKLKEVNKNERGLDISANENVLRINGISTSSGNTINLFEDKRLKKGTYTFSFISKNPPVMNSSQFILCEENGNRIVTLNAWGDTNFKTVTLEKDTIISSNKSYFYYNNNMTFNNTQYELQIEPGSTATEIIVPESQSKTILIQQAMLEKDYIEDIEHHGWKKKILNGTDVTDGGGTFAEFQTNGNIARTISISDLLVTNVRYDIKCEELPARGESVWAGVDYGINTYKGEAKILVSIPIEEIKTVYENELTVDNYVVAFNAYLSAKPITIYYKLATPLELELTPEQSNVDYQLENIELFDGMNYITATSSIDPELEVTVENPVEDYKIQVSSDGHLIIPELNIKYLIDLNESNIPIMPEATESSVRAAGRDGDIVLNTTYEPITFDIVCYTEDNLTYSEKINAEKNMNRFLNSIKNKTIDIAFEKNNSFYKVKYSGALVTTNFPKHLKFAIPLKSSDSYGKDLIQKSIVGNDTGESNTIEEVGAVFVIKGPALNPIISLNDYSMEYTTSILEGARVEIDSNKSTITNINNDGVKTNVMKYYNHQFPKIQNGTNTLKILSGIDNDKNVIVMWNDLKL